MRILYSEEARRRAGESKEKEEDEQDKSFVRPSSGLGSELGPPLPQRTESGQLSAPGSGSSRKTPRPPQHRANASVEDHVGDLAAAAPTGSSSPHLLWSGGEGRRRRETPVA